MTSATRRLVVLTALFFGSACSESTGVSVGTQAPPPAPAPPAPPGPPAIVRSATSESQRGVAAAEVWEPPKIAVYDSNNRSLEGVAVSCAVISGAGSVAEQTTRTDSRGRATCGPWTLGPSPTENTMAVGVAGLSPVIFSAVAHEPAYFENYDLQSVGGVPVPKAYPAVVLYSGKVRFAQDGTFDFLSVYIDQLKEVVPFVTHGRYSRSAEVVNFFTGSFVSPFAEGRLTGDVLTVYYFGEDAGETEVYKRIP